MQRIIRGFVLICAVAPASISASAGVEPTEGGHAPAEAIAKWRHMKFGMFIHWGPVSVQGTEIGWSRGGERRGMEGTGKVPVEVYDNLFRRFNPVKFDAREWVDIAASAGMRYMVFTTRHHDGFCNFDTEHSDYKITHPDCPYRKDIVRQLADACRAGGLAWGVYYSQPDWHHPDYLTANHDRYLKYLHGQVRELLTNYGRTDIIWFDGLQAATEKPETWDASRLFPMIRSLQPQILINNRCGLRGDFGTPEQEIGRMETRRPWETCMTIGEQWSWKPNDKLKSAKECVQTLVRVVGGDGNLLLNVGPMPDGRIEPRQAAVLRAMGQWLAKYGESIYGTRGGPFSRTDSLAATYRDNKVYLHLLDPGVDSVKLPGLSAKIVSSSVLTGGTAEVRQLSDSIEVAVPKADRAEIDTIVVLTFDQPVAAASPH